MKLEVRSAIVAASLLLDFSVLLDHHERFSALFLLHTLVHVPPGDGRRVHKVETGEQVVEDLLLVFQHLTL